jgi:hypothetical protein
MAKEYKELFNQSGIPKRLIIHFPNLSVTLRNEDIVSESMEISESLCSGTELRFGSCEASVFKLRIIGNVIPLIGETFTVSMYVGDIAEPFALGTYKVDSDKPTADRRFRDIVAYDAMHDIINADVAAWYNGILPNKDSTTTLRAFRDSFAARFSIEQEEITLPNDEMVVERTIDPEAISGKDVLSAICEINGCFAHIGRNGKMQYIVLEEIESGLLPANDLFPMDSVFPYDGNTEKIKEHYYTSCKYEGYTTKRIGKLQIRQEEEDAGCIIGTGENCYIIEGNFLVFGKSAAAVQAIGQKLFDIIGVLWYRPATVQAIGNPCLEVGAKIRLNTQHEVVETYIFERTLKGIHGLVDNYEAQGKETYSENVNSVQKSIVQLKGKMNILTRTAEETKSQIINLESDLSSQISQTAEEISAEVKRAQEAEASLSVRADEITLSVSDLETSVQSDIKVLSDEIQLRTTQGQVSSMISVALNEIVISASQITLSGNTTINEVLTVNTSGELELSTPNSIASVTISNSGLSVWSSGVQHTSISGGKISMFTPILSSYVEVASINTTGNLVLGGGNATFDGLYANCHEVKCNLINGDAPITRAEYQNLVNRISALEGA